MNAPTILVLQKDQQGLVLRNYRDGNRFRSNLYSSVFILLLLLFYFHTGMFLLLQFHSFGIILPKKSAQMVFYTLFPLLILMVIGRNVSCGVHYVIVGLANLR